MKLRFFTLMWHFLESNNRIWWEPQNLLAWNKSLGIVKIFNNHRIKYGLIKMYEIWWNILMTEMTYK
jgi:hypothetical protein